MRNLNFEPTQTNVKKNVVIVTGSSDLIGSAIIKRLAGKFELVGLDRDGLLTLRWKPNVHLWILPTIGAFPGHLTERIW